MISLFKVGLFRLGFVLFLLLGLVRFLQQVGFDYPVFYGLIWCFQLVSPVGFLRLELKFGLVSSVRLVWFLQLCLV